MRTKNNETIQILRAFAIILVLLHHSIVNSNVSIIGTNIDNVIICFHMPVFFLISGYLFELNLRKYIDNGKFKFINNKFKHLIIPYLFWTIILWIGVQVACVINESFINKIGYAPMSIFNLIKGIFTYEIYYTQHLWFLYVLFIMFIINILFSKANIKVLLIISTIIGLSTALISYPNIINRLFKWFVFFIIGRCIVNNEEIIFNKNDIKNILIMVLFVFLSIIRVSFNVGDNIFSKIINIMIMYLIGITGSYVLFLLSKAMRNDKTKYYFKKIGNYSYEIYLIHNPYFVATSSIVLSDIFKIPAVITIILSMLLGIVFPILISNIINRFFPKCSCIIGK